jgi:nucleoside-diphosphate-sugar epimerase
MLWNLVDVRDVARAHRLCIESAQAHNGSRYILSATDRSGELRTWELQRTLQALYPGVAHIGGEEMNGAEPMAPTYDSPRAYCLLAKQELGLATRDIEATLRATVDSYIALGLI